jgi:hypothetical protein
MPPVGRNDTAISLGGGVDDREDLVALLVAAAADGGGVGQSA